jgi:serine/threonine protein kinase
VPLPIVYDGGSDQQIAWYVMALLEGDTVRELCSRHGDSPGPAIELQLLERLARELDALKHHHGFHHQDIKPENMILQEGRIRLIDPIAPNATDPRHGPTHGLVTPAYNPLRLYGEDADVFGLAAVLYELRTGVVPFATLYPGPRLYPPPMTPEERRQARFDVVAVPRSSDPVIRACRDWFNRLADDEDATDRPTLREFASRLADLRSGGSR